MIKILGILINKVFNKGIALEDWQTASSSQYPRKGIQESTKTTLLSTIGKIHTRIIEKTQRKTLEGMLEESQYGFRPKRRSGRCELHNQTDKREGEKKRSR